MPNAKSKVFKLEYALYIHLIFKCAVDGHCCSTLKRTSRSYEKLFEKGWKSSWKILETEKRSNIFVTFKGKDGFILYYSNAQ